MAETYDQLIDALFSLNEQGFNLLEGMAKDSSDDGDPLEPRRWKGEELREVVGVQNPEVIYKAEKSGALPSSVGKAGQRLGSTLEDILRMQEYFGTRPWRHRDDPTCVLAFTNFKGGCWKTTTSWYAGAYYASRGFRVLLVDVDPQASLTLNCGYVPDVNIHDQDSLAYHLIDHADKSPVKSLIKDTYLPNMKLIPSSLGMSSVELHLSADLFKAREPELQSRILSRLRSALADVKGDFDIVIMDGTPSLGVLTTNIIYASTVIVAPVPTEIADYASTLSFCELVGDLLNSVKDATTGRPAVPPKVLFLPTRFSPEGTKTVGSEEVHGLIKDTFGTRALPTPIRKHDAAVSNLSLYRRTAFDVNAANPACSRQSRNSAIENFSEVFEDIFKTAILPSWPHKTDYIRATEG